MSADEKDPRRIGHELRGLRLAAGESPAKTAAAVGLSLSHLSEIEAGKGLTPITLNDLAKHFGVDPPHT